VARDLEEGSGQGFTRSGLQGGVGAALLLLLLHRPDEPLGDITLGGGPDLGFLLLGAELQGLLQLLEPAQQALEHLTGLGPHMGQLAIGEPWQIRHEHLAVVAEGEECGPHVVAAGVGLAWALRTVWRHGPGRAAAAGDAGAAGKTRTGRRINGHTDE